MAYSDVSAIRRRAGITARGENVMMRLLAAAVGAALILALPVGPSGAMRCGGDLVQKGDYKFEVLEKCGEPDMKEFVGYTTNRRGDRELKIELWVYGPRRGLYYILHFEGASLKRIETRLKR